MLCSFCNVSHISFSDDDATDEIPWSRRRGGDRLRRKRESAATKKISPQYDSRGKVHDSKKDRDENDLIRQGGRDLKARKDVVGITERINVSCSDGTVGFLNDDYCDCSDGSDEPGTSACSNLLVNKRMFQCSDGNGKTFTSRVQDGIIDCADGSDEVLL